MYLSPSDFRVLTNDDQKPRTIGRTNQWRNTTLKFAFFSPLRSHEGRRRMRLLTAKHRGRLEDAGYTLLHYDDAFFDVVTFNGRLQPF